MDVLKTSTQSIPTKVDRVIPAAPIRRVRPEQKQFEGEPTKEQLENKIEEMNKILEKENTSIEFKLHEKLNVFYVQVVDKVSKEVIQEIPNKKFLDTYASLAELMGLIVDEKL